MNLNLLFHSPPSSYPLRNYAVAVAAASSSSSSSSSSFPGAVIVGGGLSGLGAAAHLASHSVPFLLLEASDGVGGRVRTDALDGGFLLDRGFHILLTAFPECRRLLDLPALGLRPFYPGALVRLPDRRFALVSDPFRRPLRLLPSLLSPVGSLPDKLLVALARLRSAASPDALLLSAPESPTSLLLPRLGFSPDFVARFLRPFLAGIFFDPDLSTSSRLFHLVFKALALGDNALPPPASAPSPPARLPPPPDSLRLRSPVSSLRPASPRRHPLRLRRRRLPRPRRHRRRRPARRRAPPPLRLPSHL
ncbi:hypothetical protein ACMD2_07809 [Ananas comosus]|uniref:Amine oxidase domain-containing protein n=1 Tax=Ananas comosus TaxID=4615 RepID=A0A199V2U3_ANACO|nr:hypothetical protein ACMD2_07809 [Ananas comosus]